MTTGRTWKLWGHRYETGKIWNIGERNWVQLHLLKHPIIPVLVEEWLGGKDDSEVTHYGWEHTDKPGKPAMMYVRTTTGKPWMFLDMCFTYGMDVEIREGQGPHGRPPHHREE